MRNDSAFYMRFQKSQSFELFLRAAPRVSPLGLRFCCRKPLPHFKTPQLYIGGASDSAKRSSERRNVKCGR